VLLTHPGAVVRRLPRLRRAGRRGLPVSGPNVPVSGPEDGARERVARWLCERGSWMGLDWDDATDVLRDLLRGRADELLSVVADTTAGEAEQPTPHVCQMCEQPLSIHWWECVDPAARSGGAQDDGLRERITALAADMYDPEQPTSVLSHMSRLLRRALAGPDDARQDGAR
jgi:hypothetical protein